MKLYVVTYGIACVEEDGGKRELIAEIPSVTSSLDEAQRLVKLFNEKRLSPEHMEDIVEDILAIS